MIGHANPRVNPRHKRWLRGEDKAQKPEARHILAAKKVSLAGRVVLDAGRAWRSRTLALADLG